jgi:hypothetical protein
LTVTDPDGAPVADFFSPQAPTASSPAAPATPKNPRLLSTA